MVNTCFVRGSAALARCGMKEPCPALRPRASCSWLFDGCGQRKLRQERPDPRPDPRQLKLNWPDTLEKCAFGDEISASKCCSSSELQLNQSTASTAS
jgi:hypothetical protein